MKKLLTVFACFMVAFLVGCAPANKITTTKTDDGGGNVTVTTVEEPVESTSFFESGNLIKHYESEDKRIDRYNALAMEKINFVKEQGVKRQENLVTPTERALSNVVDTLLVAQIPTAPPPSNAPPPRTMIDFFDKNFVSLANLGLQAYSLGLFGDVDRPQNDSSVNIVNSGLGDVFYHSSGNKNPVLTVSGKSTGSFDFGLAKGGDYTSTTDSSRKTLW